MTDLNQKIRTKAQNKAKGKDVDMVEDIDNGPHTTAKKFTTGQTDPSTDEKFMKKPSTKGGKGKVSDEKKSSDNSEGNSGPIIGGKGGSSSGKNKIN